MKKFLIEVFLFLMSVLFLLVSFDFFVSSHLKKSNIPTGEMEVMNALYSGSVDVDVVVYGSSRAYVHFNSEIMEEVLQKKVYNLGINGNNFLLQYLRHIEYFDNNKRPKLIVLSLDHTTHETRGSLYRPDQFLPYMFWDMNYYRFTSAYDDFNFFDYWIPGLRYVGRWESVRSAWDLYWKSEKNLRLDRVKGFKGQRRGWNDDMDQKKRKNSKYQIYLNRTSIEFLERFINECLNMDIKLVFVYPPELFRTRNFVSNRSEIINSYKEIADTYYIPFIDYSEDPLSYREELFYNMNHLNHVGADFFSRKFAEDLRDLGLL